LARAEIVASQSSSKAIAQNFYDILSTPLAVWNCDADRRARLISLGLQLDDAQPGYYTSAALKPFETAVLWQRKFLEIRKACYQNVQDERATAAANDLDKFIARQAFTSDTSALARVFKSSGEHQTGYATEAGQGKKRRTPNAERRTPK
ncbi:MAG TPA: hypothetical protein VJ719_04865, partial [Chthoniobacterales bacterium]|nr:hypothetical protein [Chthoniobacterales bacterium]